jgi:hypothetical protein
MQILMNVKKRYTSVIKTVKTWLDLTIVLAIMAMNWTLLAILVSILTNAMQTYMAALRIVSMLMDSTTVVVIVDMLLVMVQHFMIQRHNMYY